MNPFNDCHAIVGYMPEDYGGNCCLGMGYSVDTFAGHCWCLIEVHWGLREVDRQCYVVDCGTDSVLHSGIPEGSK